MTKLFVCVLSGTVQQVLGVYPQLFASQEQVLGTLSGFAHSAPLLLAEAKVNSHYVDHGVFVEDADVPDSPQS